MVNLAHPGQQASVGRSRCLAGPIPETTRPAFTARPAAATPSLLAITIPRMPGRPPLQVATAFRQAYLSPRMVRRQKSWSFRRGLSYKVVSICAIVSVASRDRRAGHSTAQPQAPGASESWTHDRGQRSLLRSGAVGQTHAVNPNKKPIEPQRGHRPVHARKDR